MNTKTNQIIIEDLKQMKIDSSVIRLSLAYYMSLFLVVINIIIEVFTRGMLNNPKEKLMLLLTFSFIILISIFGKKYQSSARLITFMIGEFANIILIYLTFVKEKECYVIWSQLAPLIIMYNQSYCLETITGMVLIAFKHTFMWTFASYYYSSLTNQHPPSLISAIIGLFFLLIACSYLDHLQHISLCTSKEESKEANKKLTSLLEAVPKCMAVISENLVPLFINSTFHSILEEENVLSYLSSLSYYFRFNQSLTKNQIFQEIKRSFDLPVNSKITYGITTNKGVLTE